MSSWVIVALPDEQDRVNKISSEKVPHMTLLFLGEQDDDAMAERIAGFVEHATESSLKRFGLTVDHRGTLGPDKADVLFFEKQWFSFKDISLFRANLLKNLDIFKAYHSTEQYPEWTPHLTLGYPATPAKQDPNDYPVSYVNFDRIAFWNEDYDGPTFEIPSHEYPGDSIAMSGISSASRKKAEAKGQTMPGGGFPIRNAKDLENAIQAYGRAKNKAAAKAWIIKRARELGLTSKLPKVWDDKLEHHGVKGMHWGVHKRSSSGSNDIRSLKRSQLDKKNPEHLAEIKRRNTRNKLIVGAAGLGLYAATQAAGYAAGKAYANKVAKQATDLNRIHESKALHDGSVFVLRLLENGSFGA